jgi:hypothetical protein
MNADQAHLFSITGARLSFGALLLALPRGRLLFREATSVVFHIHVRQLSGDPIPCISNFDPAANFFKHPELHYRIRSASGTSAVLVQRMHKKTIQAFKLFRWMIDWTNQQHAAISTFSGIAGNN